MTDQQTEPDTCRMGRRERCKPSTFSFALPLALSVSLAACGGAGEGEPIRVDVPAGASFSQIADSLARHDIISKKVAFQAYGRIKGASGSLKPGTYAFKRGTSWNRILADMRAGRVLTAKLTIPEAFDVFTLAPRIAQVAGVSEDSVLSVLLAKKSAARFSVPGPTLEGYLYPATYNFPVKAALDSVLTRLTSTYRKSWNASRQARADSIGMSEREVVTLASIVEREAKKLEEMPLMSAVYHNRLRIGMALGADPTVQYALGKHREHLT
ncbi:MAG: endolytic transglycosylase MltG, partial [Longimicrobiales bacterium]